MIIYAFKQLSSICCDLITVGQFAARVPCRHIGGTDISKMTLVFVYGTLKRGEPNYDLMLKSENRFCDYVATAKTVKKWPLVIASRYNIPFLLFREDEGYNVFGEVFQVDDKMLSVMDELENHPILYERMEEEVQLLDGDKGCNGNGFLKVWIYFLKSYKSSLLELPFLEDYHSKGSHGLEYVPRYKRPPSGYFADVKIT